MKWVDAVRRNEELTMEVAALRKEVADLRQTLAAKDAEMEQALAVRDAELERKYVKIGNLIMDNGRLIKANACLADMIGARRARRKYDQNGDYIPAPRKEQQ